MSWTAVILTVSWLCFISVSEAALGTICNRAVDCKATIESCTAGSCACSNGYLDVSGECKSIALTVITGADVTGRYGGSVTIDCNVTGPEVNNTQWIRHFNDVPAYITIDGVKYSGGSADTSALTIHSLNDNDAAYQYQCTASNVGGVYSSANRAKITVKYGQFYENCTNLEPCDPSKFLTCTNDLCLCKSTYYHNDQVCYPNELGPFLSKEKATSYLQGRVKRDIDKECLEVGGCYYEEIKEIGVTDVCAWMKNRLCNQLNCSSGYVCVTTYENCNNLNYYQVGCLGPLTVITGADVTGRYGGSVTIDCTVNGPEVNNTQWMRHFNDVPAYITIDDVKYSGGSVNTSALTIHSLNDNDATYQYQCTASNVGGVYSSANRAKITIKYGQFHETCTNLEPCDISKFLTCTNDICLCKSTYYHKDQVCYPNGQFYENCTNLEPCDPSKFLTCTNNKCLCMSTFYHKDQVCYPKTGLVPTNIFLNSSTAGFSVFWNNPTNDYELVSGYTVNWRVKRSLLLSLSQLDRTVNQHTVSSGLISGQLYVVNVKSYVTLTGPAETIVVTSVDTTVRTVPSAPGPIIQSESNFAYSNLQIKWTAPVNTMVTGYEITIDGKTYNTTSNNAVLYFDGKEFKPGKAYVISIVTVSGTTDIKRSSEHTEWIRTTPTKPNPPTNIRCPQSPLDVSLEISWSAPTEPNGLVLRYQIDVSPGNLGQVYTSSNETHKNVEGLSPEQMYTFTVRTINDALHSTSDPSPSRTCKTKAGVPTAPAKMEIYEVQSRRFRIEFKRPDNVNGILAAYKIVISEGGNCVQQILIHGKCSSCSSTAGCPPPINHTVPNINNEVSYTATGLDPYIYYMVKVVAINGNGEGLPVNTTIWTNEEVPLKPWQITASNIQSSSLTLTWTLPDPSPGNTTYTIYTYEGTDDIGTMFLMKEPTNVYGFDTQTVSVTSLEEYWPYKFKVDAATVKGNTTSDFSSIFRTKQAAPGQVINLNIRRRGDDYRTAYVSWSLPVLRNHNGVLKSYLFSNNRTGTMKEEEMPVLLSQATVEKKIPVIPETVYLIKVVLQNNESMTSQISMQSYEAPAGPPPVTNIEPVTNLGEHISTENTITIDINTAYFKNDENGKQVFFGIAVCAESKCKEKTVMAESTLKHGWKDLPNWHTASKDGFPLYRVTNDTFMDMVRPGDFIRKRSTISVSTLKFIIGEDQTCPSLDKNVYCNGPLNPGTGYNAVIFACTNGGCTNSDATGPFETNKVIEDEKISIYSIIGIVGAVTLALAVIGIGILLWKRNRRHKEHKDQANTYADINLDERTNADQPYSLLEYASGTVQSKSVSLNSLYDYVVDILRNNRQKLTTEYNDLLQNTERAASTVASSKNNVSKNRGNIIPYDFNRVKLCSPGASDYIDASVLLDKFYILTSYPIAKTYGNFWQMVWEQNVSTIVVITGQSDDIESWYFSNNEGTVRTIEKINVELLAKLKSPESATMRKIKITTGKHSKVVNHFHVISLEMTDLPDQILALINTITQNNVKNTGPQVVHGGCTGIDNSGVYIAVDYIVKSIVSGGNEVDVYGTARTVMKERMLSIASLEQYSAIYTCLQKYVQNSSACKNDATGAYEYLP